jgi:hypothetical protein
VARICSPLNLLGFRPINLHILFNHKKDSELQSMNNSPKDRLFFLRSPPPFPIQCTSATGVSRRIYLGFLTEYSLPLIGFVQTTAPGTVVLVSSQKIPAFLRKHPRLHLRPHKVFCREMRYSAAFAYHFIQMCLADERPQPINFLSLLHPSSSPPYHLFVSRIIKSSDQQASIFLQQKLKIADPGERAKIIDAICARGFEMMAHR